MLPKTLQTRKLLKMALRASLPLPLPSNLGFGYNLGMGHYILPPFRKLRPEVYGFIYSD